MPAILLRDVDVIDAVHAEPMARQAVRISGRTITAVADVDKVRKQPGDLVLDLAGHTVMPGLCDAHSHMACWFGPYGMSLLPPTDADDTGLIAYFCDVIRNLEQALSEGFTTVRDAGGLDPSWARAERAGLISAPRLLPSGPMITQTGGHGDLRRRTRSEPMPVVEGLGAGPAIVDGIDEVRRAVRDAIRRGASQLKVMASGGVMSPSDELSSVQFTSGELEAAASEAAAGGRYVMAHCHSAEAIRRAVNAGIRCIEHATFLDEEAADSIRKVGGAIVSTLTPGHLNVEMADRGVLSEFNRAKALLVRDNARLALALASREGLRVGSGSDMLGSNQTGRARELVLKAEVIGAMPAIVSSTRINAEIFGLADSIGTIESGKLADVMVLAGNPAGDISLLVDSERVVLVLKEGRPVKDLLGMAQAGPEGPSPPAIDLRGSTWPLAGTESHGPRRLRG